LCLLTLPLRWNVASSLKITRGRNLSSSMFWRIRSQNSARFTLSFARRACTSCRRYGLNSQTGSGAHPASCTMGTWDSFPGGKARPGRDADNSPPSSAEVKKE
jgi:hypothetical protein